ncbi:hypothetical protein CgunFtcFv8_009889 [Champsocephalus gunnari]|uniref:Fibronectin type-III domain-containing protein n=1 Tax=Champsocephalus gunnari TaxID=52237 RepID=A0AAN8GY57_CHAGU|nr:hypothetical protein CgunFtcFv8_009889 [Champsocephalus gunnari]
MLRCKVFSVLWFSSLLLLRDLGAAPSESPSCSFSLSSPVSHLDSLSLSLSSPQRHCSFSITSGSDSTECRREGDEEAESNEIGGRTQGQEERKNETGGNYLGTNQLEEEDGGNKEEGGVFTCVLEQLEPGTAYELIVQSQSGEETRNITLHTRESRNESAFHPLSETRAHAAPIG